MRARLRKKHNCRSFLTYTLLWYQRVSGTSTRAVLRCCRPGDQGKYNSIHTDAPLKLALAALSASSMGILTTSLFLYNYGSSRSCGARPPPFMATQLSVLCHLFVLFVFFEEILSVVSSIRHFSLLIFLQRKSSQHSGYNNQKN